MAANDTEMAWVGASLGRALRRAIVVVLLGLILIGASVVAQLQVDERFDPLARQARPFDGQVEEVSQVPGGFEVKVRYVAAGLNTVAIVRVDDGLSIPRVGSQVTVLVDRREGRVSYKGANKQKRGIALPVAALLVASVAVLGLGGFDLQSAIRARRLVRRGTWRRLRWNGMVRALGRGHVTVTGTLTNDNTGEQAVVVNAAGSWRSALEALVEPAEVWVKGDTAGPYLVVHPSVEKPSMLREPRTDVARRRAIQTLRA